MIYASDLSRARETAEIVAAATGHEVRLDPALRERDFGSWEGLTREEIDARFADHDQHDGETYDEVRARVLAAANRIAEHSGETVLVVSTEAPQRALARRRRAAGPLGQLRGVRARVPGGQLRELD